MTKIVVNRCYGGFDLSHAAIAEVHRGPGKNMPTPTSILTLSLPEREVVTKLLRAHRRVLVSVLHDDETGYRLLTDERRNYYNSELRYTQSVLAQLEEV